PFKLFCEEHTNDEMPRCGDLRQIFTCAPVWPASWVGTRTSTDRLLDTVTELLLSAALVSVAPAPMPVTLSEAAPCVRSPPVVSCVAVPTESVHPVVFSKPSVGSPTLPATMSRAAFAAER